MKSEIPLSRKTIFVLKKVLLVFMIALLVALGLEGTARLFLVDKSTEPLVPPNIGQFDEMLGWSKKPFAHTISNRTGQEIEYRINDKGLRDDHTNYKKPKGIFRIVLIGDSRTFGAGVSIEKHFSILLEGYFKDVEVINMGVDGFGVDQELLYLRLEGFKYEPDLVLAYIAHYMDHRHMHTNRFGKDKPRFLVVDGELVLTNSPVIDNLQVRDFGILRDLDGLLISHSSAYKIFRQGLLTHLMRHRTSASQQKKQDKKNSEDYTFMKELHELGEALVFAMHEVTSEHGTTFVLITHMKRLHHAALKRQIFSLDVSRPLSNQAFSLPDDLGHINESGNGVLAWEIAKFLQFNSLIPSKHLIERHP